MELKEGGAAIPVTEENKEEYVRLVVSYRLDNSIKDQVKAFLDGFYEWVANMTRYPAADILASFRENSFRSSSLTSLSVSHAVPDTASRSLISSSHFGHVNHRC